MIVSKAEKTIKTTIASGFDAIFKITNTYIGKDKHTM